MVKVVALLRRREDLSRQQFDRHWREEHPRYVCPLPGLRRYVQTPALEHRREWPFDGMSELWFDTLRDVAAAFASPAADDMRLDERNFIGDMEWFLVAVDAAREIQLADGVPDQTG